MRELIEQIARALVDDPEQVEVTEISGEKTLVLELHVAQQDLGKVIGREGRTAKAMRTVLDAASKKVGKRAVLEIVE
ncbi:KH domain-containing protein [bacterium]|nr:KH domain-containing protein [bacterium]